MSRITVALQINLSFLILLLPRLTVINHKWVKVELRDGGSLPGDEARHIWFTIGSVDTFERNLVFFSISIEFKQIFETEHFLVDHSILNELDLNKRNDF